MPPPVTTPTPAPTTPGMTVVPVVVQTTNYLAKLTNRFHVAVRLFSNRSQMTSKSSSCATYLVRSKLVAHEAIAEWVTDVLTTFKHLL